MHKCCKGHPRVGYWVRFPKCGWLLDGDAMGYPGGGSPASGLYGVDNEGGANPVMCECSQIGANGDHGNMW